MKKFKELKKNLYTNKAGKFDYKKFSADRTKRPEKFIAGLDESVWEKYRDRALAEEAPHPGHVMDFSDRYEHSYHGYSDAKKSRDAFAKHLKAQGHKVKKHSLTNQLLHGSYGNVYKVSYLRPSIAHRKSLTEAALDVPTPSVEEIAGKHSRTMGYIEAQLKVGIEVEKEHTTSGKTAREIALDHLNEKDDYYKELKKVELEETTERERASHKDRIQSTLDANKTSTHDKVKHAKDTHLGAHDADDHRRILALKESTESYKVGDHVVPKIGPHKGQIHKVIHVHDTGHLNITPASPGIKNRYHLGAARAHPDQVERAKKLEEAIRPEGMTNFGKPIKLKDYFEPWKTKKSITPLTKRKTVREAFEAAKKKVQGADFDKPKDTESTDQKDPGQAEVQAQPPKEEKKSNAPAPEKKGNKIEVKGAGADDKFQPDPIVTPLTTMPDTASPKSGSQGVR